MKTIWEKLPEHFLCLAPMEGVTDIVFRQVIAKAGRPDLFFTEFTNVSSYASERGRANALERFATAPSDEPIIAQIWGKEPEHFGIVAKDLAGLGFSGIDINMGCPDRNVNRAGGGAAMIRTPELAVECITRAKDAAGNLPVSVKTRLGYTYTTEMEEWLGLLLKQDLAALTVHLRTRKEMSKVPAHFELIPKILRLRREIAPETKLIFNGDVRDRTHAEAIFGEYPEIDGLMIGRGVFTNPFCFTDKVGAREELLELLNLQLDLFDERSAILEKKREEAFLVSGGKRRPISFAPSFETLKHYFKIYVNNFPGAGDLRAKMMECRTTEEVRNALKSLEK